MTKLLVIGGTGYAGSHIVTEAAARGLEVTSISRRLPESRVESVDYQQGDLLTSTPALDGFDVVVAAVAPRGSAAGKLRAAYGQLATAAGVAGARLVAIGGFGSLRPATGAPRFVDSEEFPADYRAESAEMAAVLDDLSAADSGSDWLFVSPAAEFGGFNPGQKLGHYRKSGEVAIFDADGKSAISGADFAAAILDEIEQPSVHNAQIGVAY